MKLKFKMPNGKEIELPEGVLQSMNMSDRKGHEWFYHDLGETPSGDKFIIECRENHLEYYVKWLCKVGSVNRYRMLNFFNLKTATRICNATELSGKVG